MDGLKAALVLFVASLFQLAVLTEYHPFRTSSIVLVALLSIAGLQLTLFAMWFDMESNKDLGGRGRRRTDMDR